MCMNNAKYLNLTENIRGEFIGIGYKSYPPNEVPQLKRWKNARNKYCKYEKRVIYEIAKGDYHVGFHIFTNITDAKNYSYSGEIYEVEYKNVTAIGENETYKDNKSALCVIAQQMKVLRKI